MWILAPFRYSVLRISLRKQKEHGRAVDSRAHNEYLSPYFWEKAEQEEEEEEEEECMRTAWGGKSQWRLSRLNSSKKGAESWRELSGLILWAEDVSLLSSIHVKAMQCLLNIWKSRLENTGPEYSILFDWKAHNWQYSGRGDHSSWCCGTMSSQPVIEPGSAMYKG